MNTIIEKENCRRLIISKQYPNVCLGLELNKKHNYFPQLRRWYLRSHNHLTIETSKERADKINAVISYELRHKVKLASYFLSRSHKFNGASLLMNKRITFASDEFREYGEIVDSVLFYDYACYDGNYNYLLPPCNYKYSKLRKEGGYSNKPISKIFKNND